MGKYKKLIALFLAWCMLLADTSVVLGTETDDMSSTEESSITEDVTADREENTEDEELKNSDKPTDGKTDKDNEEVADDRLTEREAVTDGEDTGESFSKEGSDSSKTGNSDPDKSDEAVDSLKKDEESVVERYYGAYVLPGESVTVTNGEEMIAAAEEQIPNIYLGADVDIAVLLKPVEIYHNCSIFGQGHKLYGSGWMQSQLTMRGAGKTLNLCGITYDENSNANGGSLVREYDGTVNIYDCTVQKGMHGAEVDGGTLNCHNFSVRSSHQGLAVTGVAKSATANIYGTTSFTQANATVSDVNIAGISIEKHSTNYVNVYSPVKIKGYVNGVYNWGIINEIPSGSDIYSDSCGIYNSNKIQNVAGTVHGSITGIRNVGNISSCKAQIQSNTTGIQNYGNVGIAGGSIQNNSVGLDNSGTADHTGGTIKNNTKYAVLQRGTYRMSHSARVPVSTNYSKKDSIALEKNVVYLVNDNGNRHVIEVCDKFSGLSANGEPVAVIDSGSDNVGEGGDRFVGRMAVSVKTSDAATYAVTLMPYFALKFDKNYINDGIKGWYTNHWKNPDTGREQNWVRAGNGVIGKKGSLYYSIMLKAKFTNGFLGREKNLKGFSTMTVDSSGNFITPTKSVPPEESYWRGENSIFTGVSNRIRCYITLPNNKGKNQKYDLNTSFDNIGFSCSLSSKNGEKYNKTLKGGETVPGKYLMDPAAFSAVWSVYTDILYDGNSQTNEDEAPNYSKLVQTLDSPLDDNVGPDGAVVDYFGKPSYFQKETDTDRYSFAGWSYDTDCKYTDQKLMRAGESLIKKDDDPLDFIFNILTGCTTIGDINPSGVEGSVGVRLYVAWDAYPKIDAPDRAFTLSEFNSGKITKDELKKKITATDEEDGDVSGDLKLTYDTGELKGVDAYNPVKSMTVDVEVTDGFGNNTGSQFKVDVCYDLAPASVGSADKDAALSGGTFKTSAAPVYVRFIDQKNYNLGLASHSGSSVDYTSAKEACENGACEPYSVWYIQTDYKKCVRDAFGGLKSKGYVASYEFDSDDIKSINEYTKSNRMVDNANSWYRTFYNTYIAPNKV